MDKVKYIGIYDINREGKLIRDCSLAAVKKMNYIIYTLNAKEKSVQIVSIARNKKISQRKTMEKIENGKDNMLLLAPACGSQKKVLSMIGELQARVWLFFWLVMHIKKKESIIVYHSQRLMNAVYFAAKVKGFKYILEVEELYYKFGLASKRYEKEEKRFIYGAEALIASTENIVKELQYKKKAIFLHGNYQNLLSPSKKQDNIQKIVFAGGIETVRNTAFNVCECVKYLDRCFKVYLLGYGDENAIKNLNIKIKKINEQLGEERLIYCGTKIGQEYDDFMNECDIAINFQNMDEYYMKFAFPSKVLNYLNYGLTVVTTPLETIRNSEINDLVYYPENMENKPEMFALTINRLKDTTKLSKKEIVSKMKMLDRNFSNEIDTLLNRSN